MGDYKSPGFNRSNLFLRRISNPPGRLAGDFVNLAGAKRLAGDFANLAGAKRLAGDFANLAGAKRLAGDFANLVGAKRLAGDFANLLGGKFAENTSARRSVPLGARRICNPALKNVLTY